ALLAAYLEEIKLWIGKLAGTSFFQIGDTKFVNSAERLKVLLADRTDVTYITKPLGLGGEDVIARAVSHTGEILGVVVQYSSLSDFSAAYDLTIMNPLLLCGIFLGVMICFVFCAMTMKAVGRAAGDMVEEVRRQFKNIPGIMEGTSKPDYARCVAISTKGAQREMIVPSLMAIILPVVTGMFLGVPGVVGLLAGGLCCGFSLASMLNNSGGAWDNAKKFIEKGNHGGKGSESHQAGVIGDTVGDPFKDTSGPSLNILIKLMTMVSVVFTGLIVKYSHVIGDFLGF
ncbi:MAG: sodium/proton-translocating pyrophosphatase, partial [Bacteriovoracia bacterium]